MEAFVMWMAIASISISAILAGTYTERKKHEQRMLAKGGGTSKEEIKMLIAQNKDLKERVQNLEAIVTNLDEDLLLLNTVETDSKDKVKRLAEKIKGTQEA